MDRKSAYSWYSHRDYHLPEIDSDDHHLESKDGLLYGPGEEAVGQDHDHHDEEDLSVHVTGEESVVVQIQQVQDNKKLQ